MIRDFNLLVSNHVTGVHVSDIFEYFYHGMRLAGARAGYAYHRWQPHKINIILENFEDDHFVEALDFAKKQLPDSRLYLIVTELIINGRMNSSAHIGDFTNSDDANDDMHYEDHAYWEHRTQNFKKLLTAFDGIICVSEALYEGYKDLHESVFYLPLGYYVPPRPLLAVSEDEKDIDIMFSGALTPYRNQLLQKWSRAGFKVENLTAHTPEYIRADLCSRAKLYVGLKLSENTTLLSKCRSQYVLINEIPHLFEPVSSPTDMDEFINFIPHGEDTFSYVAERLRARQIPRCSSAPYRESNSVNTKTIFEELLQFCNGPTKRPLVKKKFTTQYVD